MRNTIYSITGTINERRNNTAPERLAIGRRTRSWNVDWDISTNGKDTLREASWDIT